ncbi:hypothetical protein PTTG_01718, partial [Puccinia triticina 1-1 BBBD Race 1]
SAIEAGNKIQKSIAEELSAKQMFGPFSHVEVSRIFPFFRTSPLEILSVNSFINKNLFRTTWDDFKVVAHFFKTHQGPFHLAIFDWEKATSPS